jgi:ArsR family transcriptional regulator
MDATTKQPRKLDAAARSRWQARARVAKALAHPTRLFLVDEISRGERCVCELTALVGADVSTVSKHLTVLRQAGLLEQERRGSQVFHRLRVPCVLGFFDCLEGVVTADAERRSELACAPAPRKATA